MIKYMISEGMLQEKVKVDSFSSGRTPHALLHFVQERRVAMGVLTWKFKMVGEGNVDAVVQRMIDQRQRVREWFWGVRKLASRLLIGDRRRGRFPTWCSEACLHFVLGRTSRRATTLRNSSVSPYWL